MRALDLFCCAGGISEGLRRAGFDVVGVDNRALAKYYRGGRFVQANALEFDLSGFDYVHASPPCQKHSVLRHLHPDKTYVDLIPETRAKLKAWGGPYSIENVPGAPLGGGGYLIQLCGTMFGLATPDGRAEIQRHRLFELNWCPGLQPACQHGYIGGHTPVDNVAQHRKRLEQHRVICVAGGKAMSGGMSEPQGMRRRRAMSVTGGTPQTNTVHNISRETFSIADARAAMGMAEPWDCLPMKYLSQAIPPAYGEWLGRRAIEAIEAQRRRA